MLALEVGQPVATGNADGRGVEAYFNAVTSLSFRSDGSAVAVDLFNNSIRRVQPDGTTTTVAGSYFESVTRDGPVASARFSLPGVVAAMPDGTIYVLEGQRFGPGASARIRRISPQGEVTTVPVPPTIAAMTVAPGGTVYLASASAVYRWNPDTGLVLIAGAPDRFGAQDGPVSSATLNSIREIAADRDGNVWMTSADFQNLVRKLSADGVVTTIGASGSVNVDGDVTSARFNRPNGVAVDRLGNAWVVQWDGIVRRVTPEGQVSSPFGGKSFGSDATAPRSIAVAPDGDLWLGTPRGVVRVDSSSGRTTPVAGQDFLTVASLTNPAGLASDGKGTLWWGDTPSSSFDQFVSGLTSYTVWRRDAAGTTRALATLQPMPPATFSLTSDDQGNVYASQVFSRPDTFNRVATGGAIMKIDAAGVMTTLADFSAGTARPVAPARLVRGRDGVFRFIDVMTGASMTWSAAAGLQPPPSKSVGGQLAGFIAPLLAVDPGGTVYSANTQVVFGLAGSPRSDFRWTGPDGAGGAAVFGNINAMVAGPSGNLYVADRWLVRKVTPAGVVTTVAGQREVIGFRAGPAPSTLPEVKDLAIGADGVLHILTGGGIVRMQVE